MKKTKEEIKPYYFVDEYGMMLVSDTADQGKGDSIGRNFNAYMATGDEKFVDAIMTCYDGAGDGKTVWLQGWRHPSYINKPEHNNLSRDHVIYTVLALKMSGREDELNRFISLMTERHRISDRYTFTPDSWLWMKASANTNYEPLWYLLTIPVSAISVLWNKVIGLFAKGAFKEVPQSEYNCHIKVSDRLKKLRKLRYPAYALHQMLWMNYSMTPGIGKWLHSKLLLLDSGNQNWLNHILAGKKVSREDVMAYRAMHSDRWTTRLDQTNDRNLYIFPNAKASYLDVALLRNMFKRTNKI